jgi:hypothetical protein
MRKPGLIDARSLPGRIVFQVCGDPPRTVLWSIDDAGLTALAARRRRPARGAFGSGAGGWNLLVAHLEEELLTFRGTCGRVRVDSAGGITVEEG